MKIMICHRPMMIIKIIMYHCMLWETLRSNHHHQNPRWGYMFWKNGVHHSKRVPETWRIWQWALELVQRLVVAQLLPKKTSHWFSFNLSPICSSKSALNILWNSSLKTLKSALKQDTTAEIPKLEGCNFFCWYQLKLKSASPSSQPNPPDVGGREGINQGSKRNGIKGKQRCGVEEPG